MRKRKRGEPAVTLVDIKPHQPSNHPDRDHGIGHGIPISRRPPPPHRDNEQANTNVAPCSSGAVAARKLLPCVLALHSTTDTAATAPMLL